jgi:GTP cyclohydrolase I
MTIEMLPFRGDTTVLDGRVPIDLTRATAAAHELLLALGVTPLEETPRRIAQAYAELLSPRPFALTTFPNEEGYDELVLARGIPFTSLCEHHALPFVGTAHVGYLPDDRIVGLSKLARVVEHFARRLQVQERMTVQIADLLEEELAPRGVGVVIEAEHMCMTIRGVGSRGACTTTSARRGILRDDARSRQEFFSLTNTS